MARLQFADRNCRRMVKDLERAKKRLETRLKLIEGELRGQIDLTQLGKPELLTDVDKDD